MSLEDLLKRAIDIAGASVGIVVTGPIMAAAAAAILIETGMPVLFTQTRPGLHAKHFTLYKFRTMREPRAGEDRYASDGARLSKLGRLLRETSVDELPSLFNVLRGDMSLVGPRPLLIEYLPLYSKRQARRHEVKPGVTGLTQVRGRNSLNWGDKLELDVEYVESRSIALDLMILRETVLQVLRREGVSHKEHPTMPQFHGTLQQPRER